MYAIRSYYGLPRALREKGLTPLTHTQLPPGDACISLGQAAYGLRVLERQEADAACHLAGLD